MPHKNYTRKNIDPLSTINWATKSSKNVDVFVFMGTHDMNINNLVKSKKYYEKYSGKRVKYVLLILITRNLFIERRTFQSFFFLTVKLNYII
jgi:hypothetical protein